MRVDATTEGLSPASGPLVSAGRTTPQQPSSVLIAGGGVAALEAVLALRQLSSDLSIVLVAPQPEFTLRQFSVGQPFGSDSLRRLDLANFCAKNGVELRRDQVAEVWGSRRSVLLGSGEELSYDSLLLATGARPVLVLPGARVFRGPDDVTWFGETLDKLQYGGLRRLAFAVPREVRWALPLYELALMTARMVRDREIDSEILFFSHESAPLADLGVAAGDRVTAMFDAVGIEPHFGRAPLVVEHGSLRLSDGHLVDVSAVVSLPALRVPQMTGVTQSRHGFIPTDATMRVEGMDGVWAAGDATWFPIKQGGIAAQQADVAAAAIAGEAGVGVDVPAFVPVLRGALLTGDEPQFFSSAGDGDNGSSSSSPLWWPPGKVAGRWLAPYLAREWSGNADDPLVPLQDRTDGPHEMRSEHHREALDLALRFAAVDADEGDFGNAVRWLDVAEQLNLTLPATWSQKRAHWRELARTKH